MAQKQKRKLSKRGIVRRRERRLLLLGFVFVCLLIILGVVYIRFHNYVKQFPEDQIYETIYIGPVDVSGMTRREALKAMAAQLENEQSQEITLDVAGESTTVTAEDLGLSYEDIRGTVDEAMAYGKEGSLFQRYFALKSLEKQRVTYEESFVLDTASARDTLENEAVPLANHAVNATITKTSSGFSITEEAEGQTIDLNATITKLSEFFNTDWDHKKGTVSVVETLEEPTIRAADLTEIQDVLGTYSTDAGSGDRWQNLKAGAEHINGTIVMPGEEASAYELTGPYDEEGGYVEAGSYENGQLVETYGGGICQVSTTLYNALLYAELEITERYPHSMTVGYVDPSRDAAIAEGSKDLKFKNNYETPIYIAGEITEDNTLVFTIYGKETRDPGRSVEFESETLSTEDYETVYQSDTSLDLGEMESDSSPHTGREAQLWKIVYQDGEEVSRDVINTSSYKRSDNIVKVGVHCDSSAAIAVVDSAVASQDLDKIKAAIAEAKGML